MIISVPRERKDLETRVALTPTGVTALCTKGHTVLIETDAGLKCGITDQEYTAVGAEIISSLKEVWDRAELLVKVKEPAPEEIKYFRSDLTAFCFLHLASLPQLTKALLSSGMTSIAYELVKSPEGRFPILEPMSVVAGKLAVVNGSNHMLSQHGGRGLLIGGACGTAAAKVSVIGAGIAGTAAVELALEMGAEVTVLDINEAKLASFRDQKHPRLTALISNDENRTRAVAEADLLIGAALLPGAKPPLLVSKEMVQSMKTGAVVVDISIDQGGCIETIRPTSLSHPTYVKYGVIHYGVCNMPAQVPLTSTYALTQQTLPYILSLASGVPIEALKGAINTQFGKLTNQAVADALGLPFN